MTARLWSSIPLILMLLAQPVAAQGDAENGKEVFKVCRSCHQVGDGARNTLLGPSLNGIIGRKAGTVSDFTYSDANKQAGEKGLVWTEDKLLEYLRSPADFMPGNKMKFTGLKDQEDRRDIIAYLKQFSK
jgi:cytochrome c